MSIDSFIANFQNAIDVEDPPVTPDTDFKKLDIWDSLCVLNVIAMVDEAYGVTLSGRQIEAATSVKDLFDVVLQLKG